MNHGICLLSTIAGRKEPAHSSEMVTQLLFGEHYEVQEEREGWLKIKNGFDGYVCWISARQHSKLSETAFRKLRNAKPVFCADPVQWISNSQTKASFPVSIGCMLPNFDQGFCTVDEHRFHINGNTRSSDKKLPVTALLDIAVSFLHAPYLWGGRSLFGIDCSAFVQTVFKLGGYVLPRDSADQVHKGTLVDFFDEAVPGDLAFFDNEEGKIVHTGIILNGEKIIHASGSVRIDKIDHFGIVNSETRKYSHTLRVVKRVLADDPQGKLQAGHGELSKTF
jgi:hypothetical protein